MTVNVTEFAELDCLQHGWDLKGWWVGWIGERILVLPLADTGIHVSPSCRCKPQVEIINGKPMLSHNAFDGRESLEGDRIGA